MSFPDVARVYQSLLGMLPRGWRAVELTLERTPVRVVNLNVQAVAPATAPPTLLDQNDAIAAINEELARVPGDFTRARFVREPGPMLLTLDAAGATQSQLALAPSAVDELVITDALFDAIDRAHAAFDARQREFDAQIAGFRNWGFDQTHGSLSFVLASGEERVGPGLILGSWASQQGTWLWGWANDSVADDARDATSSLRDTFRDAPGLAALRTAELPCRLPLASHLAILAAAHLGAEGVFGGRHDGGAVFIAALAR